MKYTKKQIQESIVHWKKVLESMNEFNESQYDFRCVGAIYWSKSKFENDGNLKLDSGYSYEPDQDFGMTCVEQFEDWWLHTIDD